MDSTPSKRRTHRRAKVGYFACIRNEAFGDDIVSCIDMSRGGLSFKTKNSYTLSTIVRIAVLFAKESPHAPAIFVPAKIVNSGKLPNLQFFRIGAALFVDSLELAIDPNARPQPWPRVD
jgi:hypothetical protein